MEITYVLDTQHGVFLRKRSDSTAIEYKKGDDALWITVEQSRCADSFRAQNA